MGYLTFGLSTHPPRRSACRDSFKNSLFLYLYVWEFCEIADFHRHALIFCSAFSAGPTTVRSGKPHAACAALRFAPLRWSALAFAGLTIVFYYNGHRLFFNFFHFLIFDSRFFFWGRLGARFLIFRLGRWGRSFVSEFCEIVDFHIFLMSACYSCRQKFFSKFWDSQTYMRVSPSHHFLSQLFLYFLQPNYLSTFLEKPTFWAIMLSRLYDWLNINVLSSWPSSSSFCIFLINSKTFRFCRVGNFYFRQLIQKMFIIFW